MEISVENISVSTLNTTTSVAVDLETILKNMEYSHFIDNELPVIVFLILLIVLGIVGNTHALIVYSIKYKPSNHRTFVIWLASVDLLASCLSLPFETFDIRYSYTFSIQSVCKIFREINYFVGVCSGFLLCVIAVERFRKACKPMGRQLSEREALAACFVTVVFAIFLSVPSLFMYGLATKVVPGLAINGTECTVLDSYRNTFSFQAYNFVMLFLSTSIFIICIVLYSFVGKVLYQQSRFRMATQSVYVKTNVNGTNGKISEPSSHVHEDESSSAIENSSKKSNSLKPLSTKTSPGKKKRFSRNKQITFMFLIATAVSYFWYLPNLTLTIIKSLSRSKFSAIEMSLGAFTDILVRTYFVSNVTNPIVYCLLDRKFRSELKTMYKKFSRLCKPCWKREMVV